MLRDYQIDICSRVSEAFDKHRSVMVQMPTGTGKTVVLAELVKQFLHTNTDCTVVIVAHRRELIEQIKATIKRMGLNANNHSSIINNQNIIVESIQTISRRLTSNGVATPPHRGAGGPCFLFGGHRRSPPRTCQDLQNDVGGMARCQVLGTYCHSMPIERQRLHRPL